MEARPEVTDPAGDESPAVSLSKPAPERSAPPQQAQAELLEPGPDSGPQPEPQQDQKPWPPEPGPPEPEPPEPEPPEPEIGPEAGGQDERAAAELAGLGDRIDQLTAALSELTRLRVRDTDLITRLHDDVTRLRNGEIAIALNPVVTGMIKLHDQMVSLGALNDPASPVGLLHAQLLQIMELTCAVKPFSPEPGERFDASHHTGTRRVPTVDPAADGTIARTIRVGFARADGSVARVAEVEVHRLPS